MDYHLVTACFNKNVYCVKLVVFQNQQNLTGQYNRDL